MTPHWPLLYGHQRTPPARSVVQASGHPFEPSNYTPIMENHFLEVEPATGSTSLYAPLDTLDWIVRQTDISNQSIQNDATVSYSAPEVLRILYPTNLAWTGVAPCRSFFPWFNAGVRLYELYMDYTFMYSDPFWAPNGSNTMKQFFIDNHDGQFRDRFFGQVSGGGDGTLRWAMATQGVANPNYSSRVYRWDGTGSVGDGNFKANEVSGITSQDTVITRGLWHRAQHRFIVSDPGVENGTYFGYFDGKHVMQYSNEQMLPSTANGPYMDGFPLEPTWGGSSLQAPYANQYMYWGHLYISGLTA